MISDRRKIICYFNILGFPNAFNLWINKRKIPEKLNVAINNAVQWIGGKDSVNRTRTSWVIRGYKEGVCLIRRVDEMSLLDTLVGLAMFQRTLILAGFLIRGGVTIGELKFKGEQILSENLDAIVEVEKSIIIYPRLSVSKNYLKQVELIFDDYFRLLIKELLIRDIDNHIFVDYLNIGDDEDAMYGDVLYKRHKMIIENGLECKLDTLNNGDSIIEWVSHFYQWHLRAVAENLKRSAVLSDDDVWDFLSLNLKIGRTRGFQSLLWSDRMQQEESEFQRSYSWIDWITDWPNARSEDDEPSEDNEPSDEIDEYLDEINRNRYQ